jgi:hypothetical protein
MPFMKKLLILCCLTILVIAKADSQSVLSAATQFINSLDAEQKAKAVYPLIRMIVTIFTISRYYTERCTSQGNDQRSKESNPEAH